MSVSLKYNIELPESVSEILEQDFWMFDGLNAAMMQGQLQPVKFSSCVAIYVRRGECRAELNLVHHDIKAPCLVTIGAGHILQPSYVSPDFDASFLVFSKRMTDNIFMLLSNVREFVIAHRFPVAPIPEADVDAFERHYDTLRSLSKMPDNPYLFNAVSLEVAGFFYRTVYRCFKDLSEILPYQQSYISQQFMILVQRNFKRERFLGFYARQLGITTKHLSRMVKEQTGYTAVEWIERFVVLEARIMLKSSTLTIQQISEELNFPTQSLFGKYFKKCVGMTPKEFRNNG